MNQFIDYKPEYIEKFELALQKFSEDILKKYKGQQAPERGFSFLKDPGFFAHSVFLKSPHRIEVMAMLMGLCLLVYTIGQRQLRLNLKQQETGLKNPLGKLTDRPTLRWIFPNRKTVDFNLVLRLFPTFSIAITVRRAHEKLTCW